MDPVHREALSRFNLTANYYSVMRGVASQIYLGAVRARGTLKTQILVYLQSNLP